MTLQQIESVYRANLGLGHQAALSAVFAQGYCLGAGTPNTAIDISFTVAAPATTVKLKDPLTGK